MWSMTRFADEYMAGAESRERNPNSTRLIGAVMRAPWRDAAATDLVVNGVEVMGYVEAGSPSPGPGLPSGTWTYLPPM